MANIPLRSCREMNSLPRQQTRRASRREILSDAGGGCSFNRRGGRQKLQNMEKEPDIEAVASRSADFPTDSPTEDGMNAGMVNASGGSEQEYMSQGQVNYRVSPRISAGIVEQVIKANVVIIGAGLAGLAAGRELVSLGFKVLIIEGRKRPGGRVYTRRMEGAGQVAAVDLGGSVISGFHENPLGLLARQLSVRFHKIKDNCPPYHPDGKPVDAEIQSRVEESFKDLLGKASELRQMTGALAGHISLGTCLEIFKQVYGVAGTKEEKCLLNWHFANLENSYAAMLSELSVAFWEQNGSNQMEGDRCLLSGGNCRLIQALTENVPIFYGKTVSMIRYNSNGVQVTAGGQQFQADMALCTVPLGVLKRGSIRFDPALPQRKLAAIERLGFGLLNKIAILFPYAFWDPELDMFSHLCEDASNRGEFFLFYSYASVSGGPVLIALVAGESAVKFETMQPPDSLHRVLHILRGIYGPKGIDVPDPIQTIVTRWGGDPLCLGACSHVAAGGSGDDYDILAESAGGRLFFAGEATHRQYPATMHGAFLSGLREAEHMSNVAG